MTSRPASSRPRRVVVVAGTGTEVGKTWVAARLAEHLIRRGMRVVARKPAQSFEASAGAGSTDAEVLAAVTADDPHLVCPAHRWYEVPMAPFMAADVLGRPPVLLQDLLDELVWPSSSVDIGLVEMAGGVRSPMTTDGCDTVDFAAALDPDLVLLVADAGLGTLNAVRLCLGALATVSVAVLLNRYDRGDDLHRRNLRWLREHTDGVPLCTTLDDLARYLTC